MFSREGKDGHSRSYSLIDGMLTASRNYLHPTVALVSSFRAPTAERPTLLTHDEVETLFHDFGCALQTVLTRAKFGRFSDTRGAAEFFEASSRVFESWAWDRRVVDSFAADYRDPSKKLPRKTLAGLKEARRATASVHYQRELALAKLDLALHTEVTAENHRSTAELANQVLTDNFLPPAGGAAGVTMFEPLSNNGAEYYGHVWADVIGADMTSAFKRSVGGLYDTRSGRRMRTEVYAPGGSRDASRSIEAFLQRKQSTEPFWKTVGVPESSRAAR
jgi:thimet oligopeptidase